MSTLAIIGGSGLTQLENLVITDRHVTRTPFGEPSGALIYGTVGGNEVIFLARHGHGHTIPPHVVNYRANLWALHEAGVQSVIAVAAVGAIDRTLKPSDLVLPDQIIDYTYARAHTFFEGQNEPVTHVDFTQPYCEDLRGELASAAEAAGIPLGSRATYAATQGPRFESVAEIDRLERDGAHIVGMTGMPEAALARELGLCYATVAVIANPAAGRAPGVISLSEVEVALAAGMKNVRALLEQVIPQVLSKA